jgi:hypothetical protein
VLTGSATPPTPIQVRTDAAPLLGGTGASNLSAAQLQAVRNALAAGTGVTLSTGSGVGTLAQSSVFPATGVRMSEFEVNQALQLAISLLAQQGVLNPTAEQLRVALFGGTLLAINGSSVPVVGVLQGGVRNTSDSTRFNTSASPALNTSASRNVGTAPATGGATSAGVGAALPSTSRRAR